MILESHTNNPKQFSIQTKAMSTDPSINKSEKVFDLETFMKATDISNQVKQICEETIDRLLKAALPPDMAEIATMKPFDFREQKEKWEREALEAAAAGTGPQPYDREWHTNECDADMILEFLFANDIGWHLSNDLHELAEWAISSGEGQRALSLDGDPVNPRQDLLNLLNEIRDALSTYRRDILSRHAERLGWDGEIMDEIIPDARGC